MAEDLVLYMMPTCPYCQKVLRFMAKHDIQLDQRNILADPAALEQLETVGGKHQVPCLFINGKPLYESDDIIAYLEKTFC